MNKAKEDDPEGESDESELARRKDGSFALFWHRKGGGGKCKGKEGVSLISIWVSEIGRAHV